jgi:hypothetical protein
MIRRILSRLTYANAMATIAVFIAIGGGAYAAGLAKDSVKSKQIKNGAVKGADIHDNAITSPKVKDGSLLGSDFAAGQLPAGKPGEDGEDGQDGDDGSPDTGQQILGKLATVDGAGSGLDADAVDGLSPAQLGDVQSARFTVPQSAVAQTFASITGITNVTSTTVGGVRTGTPNQTLIARDLFVRLDTQPQGPVSVSVIAGGSPMGCSIGTTQTTCDTGANLLGIPAGSQIALQIDEGINANAQAVTATVGFRLAPG